MTLGPDVDGLNFTFTATGPVLQYPEPTGWFAGDPHSHRSCGGPPDSVASIVRKMTDQNLAVVSLLADMGNGEVENPAQDLPRVTGGDDASSTAGHILHWDAEWHWDATFTQYPHQALGGHVVALGLTEAHQIWEESTYPVFSWAHKQNGIAGFAHLQYLDGDFPSALNCCAPVEYPVEVALGTADFISEDVNGGDTSTAAYYRLLNSGLRPGFAAASDYPCSGGTTRVPVNIRSCGERADDVPQLDQRDRERSDCSFAQWPQRIS